MIGVTVGPSTMSSVTGDRVEVVTSGIAEMEAGAAITVGAMLTVDTSGAG